MRGYASTSGNATLRATRAIAVAAIATIATVGTAAAVSFGNGVYWTHNGSWMTITKSGPNLYISYDEPRSGLSVGRGTTLFQGSISGNAISGTAYTFKRGCAPAPYSVSGRLRRSGGSVGSIVLSGAAPVRKGGCGVQGYSNNSSNARLVFNYAGTGD